MIQLNGIDIKNCPVDDLPEKVQGHSAVNSEVGPIVCGGHKCHRLIISNGSWDRFHPLNIGRHSFSISEINELLVIIGGASRSSSIEYINVLNGTKWIKKDMPFDIYNHCSTKINQTTILMTGGRLNKTVTKMVKFYIIKMTFTH